MNSDWSHSQVFQEWDFCCIFTSETVSAICDSCVALEDMSSNDTVTPVNFKLKKKQWTKTKTIVAYLGVAILTPPHLIAHAMEVFERYGKDGPGLKYLVVGDTVRRKKDRRETTANSIVQRTSKILKVNLFNYMLINLVSRRFSSLKDIQTVSATIT